MESINELFQLKDIQKHSNVIVRLAINHFDRPTDLKNAILNVLLMIVN